MAQTILQRTNRAGGMISAPWLFLASRVMNSERMLSRAVEADPLFVRGMEQQARLNKRGDPAVVVAQLILATRLAAAARNGGDLKVKSYLSVSESQLLQDVACVLATGEKKNGYFLEVGVGSGRTISNTYMLEKHLSWDGILVEPNLSSHDSILACRSARLERRAAASVGGQTVEFEEAVDAGEHSRLAKLNNRSERNDKLRTYQVETVTLNDLLAEHGSPSEIDYLSLDTEGSELDILKGLDLERYRFGFMTIEHNYAPGVVEALHSILAPRGYRQILPDISQFDAWFIHETSRSDYLD